MAFGQAEILLYIFTFVTTVIYSIDCIAFHERRERWIALGEDMQEDGENGSVEIDRYNVILPVSTTTEVVYKTKNGKRINSVIATATKMNGFVSLENGGLEEDHVTMRYTTENGFPDEFYVFVESYKIDPFILNDNSAKTGNVAVVINDIRNWTEEILQQAIFSRENPARK